MNTKILAALATIMALCDPPVAMAQDRDVIDGYRTNDFFRFLPEDDKAPDGFGLKSKNSNPAQHMITAEYVAEDTSSMANVRIVGWPLKDPVAIAETDTDILQRSIDGIRRNISDEGWPEPEEFQVTPASGRDLSCLRTQQTEQAEFVYCVTSIKGRLMEIQHLSSIEAKDAETREEVMTEFVEAFTNHMEAAE